MDDQFQQLNKMMTRNGFTLVPDDAMAKLAVQQGQWPVIGQPDMDDETFNKLRVEQWESPMRIFGRTKAGEPVVLPWEDMAMGERYPEEIVPIYNWEIGQGYPPQELLDAIKVQRVLADMRKGLR